jgi:hypothetical protein
MEGGAEYFLPGIWGCTLNLEVPRIGGYRGLIETTSTIFLMTMVVRFSTDNTIVPA